MPATQVVYTKLLKLITYLVIWQGAIDHPSPVELANYFVLLSIGNKKVNIFNPLVFAGSDSLM
jgi:hypothetical protein